MGNIRIRNEQWAIYNNNKGTVIDIDIDNDNDNDNDLYKKSSYSG